jgi:hypothetical protein
MSFRKYILAMFVILGFTATLYAPDKESAHEVEYKIKAAFLYNFVKFSEWPADADNKTDLPLRIAILGDNPFGKAFEPVKDEKLKERTVEIKEYQSMNSLFKDKNDAEIKRIIEELKQAYVVFISSSEEKNIPQIVKLLEGSNVLTISEVPDFLKSGGIINLIKDAEKVRFEVNPEAMAKNNIKMRAQLMRLARNNPEKK